MSLHDNIFKIPINTAYSQNAFNKPIQFTSLDCNQNVTQKAFHRNYVYKASNIYKIVYYQHVLLGNLIDSQHQTHWRKQYIKVELCSKLVSICFVKIITAFDFCVSGSTKALNCWNKTKKSYIEQNCDWL